MNNIEKFNEIAERRNEELKKLVVKSRDIEVNQFTVNFEKGPISCALIFYHWSGGIYIHFYPNLDFKADDRDGEDWKELNEKINRYEKLYEETYPFESITAAVEHARHLGNGLGAIEYGRKNREDCKQEIYVLGQSFEKDVLDFNPDSKRPEYEDRNYYDVALDFACEAYEVLRSAESSADEKYEYRFWEPVLKITANL